LIFEVDEKAFVLQVCLKPKSRSGDPGAFIMENDL
jgi:hypothetical protein